MQNQSQKIQNVAKSIPLVSKRIQKDPNQSDEICVNLCQSDEACFYGGDVLGGVFDAGELLLTNQVKVWIFLDFFRSATDRIRLIWIFLDFFGL